MDVLKDKNAPILNVPGLSLLGKDLWAKAILTHVYICNRSPSSILLNGITPYEKVFSHTPSIGHIHVFGLKCFIKVPDENRTKLDDKAKECCLIGYEGNSICVVVDMDKKKLWSSNVIFLEGNAHCQSDYEASILGFPKQESVHIKEVNEMESEAKEKRKRWMRSEV